MLVIIHVHCALGTEKQLDFFRKALRAESHALGRKYQKEKPDPLNRPPVRKLARAQTILGDIEGALKTASIPQGTGWRAQIARFETLGDIAEVLAEGNKLDKSMGIVEEAPPAVRIRVLLAFAVANAKRKVPSVEEAFRTAHRLAGELKRRAKVNALRRIAAAESKAGNSKAALKTCMQAVEVARGFASPRERAWTLTSIARTMVATGHKDAAVRLANETLSVIEKVSGMQAEEIKIDAMSDVTSILGQCREFYKARDVLENLPGSKETFYGDKAGALASLAISVGDVDYKMFLEKITSKRRHDQVVTSIVKALLSGGKHAKALTTAKSFKTDGAWGESMLRIALGLARNGDLRQARKIVEGIGGGLFSDHNHALKWFNLKTPNTWANHWAIDTGREMKIRVAAAAIPVWYELEADGELKKSPVELIDSEKLRYDWGLVKALAKSDAYCGDPNVVMRWTAPYLKELSPGEPHRVSLLTTIATQAAKRLREPPRVRRRKTLTTVWAAVTGGPYTPTLQGKLVKQFDALTTDPKSYRTKVSRECKRFPEGDILPYTLPAIAYANMTLSDPLRRTETLRRISGLLAPAIENTIVKVKPPGRDLANLISYRKHATYLGQLNMALGYYRLIGGDDRYQPINKAISDALHKALVELKGRPLQSSPTYWRTFDTIPALVSLKLYDHNTDTDRSDAVIRRHLDWMSENATHKSTNLPYSRINNTGRGIDLPRGCDLSWRISLIAHLDLRLAKTMYYDYIKAFWIDRKTSPGFAEWPGGKSGKQDADSGPIIVGIGTTASWMGLATASAAGDTRRAALLDGQTTAFTKLVWEFIEVRPQAKLILGGRIKPAGSYMTCFLYDDARLFYAATWQALPTRTDQPTTRPKPTDSP
jgi:hypothetical protein